MSNPYFDSASQNIDQAKMASLQAVAQAGTAGKAAFQQAQDAVTADKQAALARAATRAQTLGVGGNDQTFTGAADLRLGQLATNRAGFEGGLAQTGASASSYMDKVKAGLPLLQAINTNKSNAQEAAIKAAIALAAQKAQAAQDAANAAAARADARSQASADRADARSARSSAAADARASKTAAAKDPSFDRLVAAGKLEVSASPLNKARLDTGNILGAVTENPDIRMARLAGQDMGYSPLQIGTALNQSKTNSYTKAATPLPTPDEKWLTTNIRGMDSTKAKQALAAPEFIEAGNQAANYFTVAPIDPATGKINDGSTYDGLSPKDAFRKYVYSQQGNLTMKDAAFRYYGDALKA